MASKVLLCAYLKMENHYLEEWLQHYLNLGVDKFVFYDNNDIEGPYAERIEDLPLVKENIDNGKIDVYKIPGEIRTQITHYNECYAKYSKEYDWLMFFDIDEFLEFKYFSNIHDFLDREVFDPFEAVLINWKLFGDSDLIRVENGDYSLVKRFTKPAIWRMFFTYNNGFKTILRGGIKKYEFISPHGNDINKSEIATCNARGESIKRVGHWKLNVIDHRDAWLNHYITKTAEEFIKNKMIRGGGNLPNRASPRLFYGYNEMTEEKEAYFAQFGINMDDYKY